MISTIIKATKTTGLLLLVAFANPLTAGATTDYDLGWYVGGNIGISDTNIDEDKITKNLINPSYTDDDSDLGYKLFGGYQFNKYFALEGGYFNLGKFDYALSAFGGTKNGSLKVTGLNLDAVGILPITEDFSAFGRVGANYAQVKDSFSTTGSLSMPDANPDKNALNYKFGAGLQYAITDAVGIRLEAERYRINDAVGNSGDINLFSVGLTYRFGKTTKAAPVSKQEKVISPTPEKEEVLIVVTEPEAEKKIQESVRRKRIVILVLEDVHFNFDKSTLSKEAKNALKKDITQLKKNPKLRMIVSGYTSKMGTKKYNQDLSERRAQSVKDYLVKEELIPADKVSIRGYGETRPLVNEAKPKHIYSNAAKANMRAYIKIIYE